MSTETTAPAAATVVEANPMFALFADALKGHLAQMTTSQNEFGDDWQRHSAEMNNVMSEATKNMGRRKVPPLTPEMQAIVTAMQQFPLLIPVLRALVDNYMADVAAAYATVNAKYTVQPKTDGESVPNN